MFPTRSVQKTSEKINKSSDMARVDCRVALLVAALAGVEASYSPLPTPTTLSSTTTRTTNPTMRLSEEEAKRRWLSRISQPEDPEKQLKDAQAQLRAARRELQTVRAAVEAPRTQIRGRYISPAPVPGPPVDEEEAKRAWLRGSSPPPGVRSSLFASRSRFPSRSRSPILSPCPCPRLPKRRRSE